MEQEALYYGSVFVIAALAGLSRVLHNGDFRSKGHCAAVAFMSGMFGFGLVAILYGGQYVHKDTQPIFFLGVAAFVGLSGKEQVIYIGAFSQWIKSKFGIGTGNDKT